ncbi:hypothetical protein CDAR_437371 [Caerostris darwini]|uniref:Uncharacterized protein n=1 Tax=Caerostris darwini TaxID=1538125 RepID=A0AAV4QNZ6_9ARAC|nr:hypothetical protein CDAR_437371 [Caerostris darwini]
MLKNNYILQPVLLPPSFIKILPKHLYILSTATLPENYFPRVLLAFLRYPPNLFQEKRLSQTCSPLYYCTSRTRVTPQKWAPSILAGNKKGSKGIRRKKRKNFRIEYSFESSPSCRGYVDLIT